MNGFLKIILILNFIFISGASYAGDETGGYDGDPEYQLRRQIFIQQGMATFKADHDYEKLVLPIILVTTKDVNDERLMRREGVLHQFSMDREAIANYMRGRKAFDNIDGSSSSILGKGSWEAGKNLLGAIGAPAHILLAVGIYETKNKIERIDQSPMIEQWRKEMKGAVPEILSMFFDWANLDEKNLDQYNEIRQRWQEEKLWEDLPSINPDEPITIESIDTVINSLPAPDDQKVRLKQSIEKEIEDGKSVKDAVEKGINEFKKDFSEALQNLNNETKKNAQGAMEIRMQEAEQFDSAIKGLQGATNIITFFLILDGTPDSKRAAHDMSVVVSAQIQIATALFNFTRSAAGDPAALVTAVGAIAQAFSGIMSGLQPDPAVEMHEQVMEALQAISEQIESVRTDILQKIEVINAVIITRTQTIMKSLEEISKKLSLNIDEARSAFMRLSIGQCEMKNMLHYIGTDLNGAMEGFRRAHWSAFEEAASEVYTENPLDSTKFKDYKSAFLRHATDTAKIPVMSGERLATVRDDVSCVLQLLLRGNQQFLYNYLPIATAAVLSNIPVTDVMGPIIESRKAQRQNPEQSTIPNPLEWVNGAWDYAALYLLQPEYKINQEDLDTIIKDGEAIQSTIREWRTLTREHIMGSDYVRGHTFIYNPLLRQIHKEYYVVLRELFSKTSEIIEAKFKERLEGSADKSVMGYVKSWEEEFKTDFLKYTTGSTTWRTPPNPNLHDDVLRYENDLHANLGHVRGELEELVRRPVGGSLMEYVFRYTSIDRIELFKPSDLNLQRFLALAKDNIKLEGFWEAVRDYRSGLYTIECGWEIIRTSDDSLFGTIRFKAPPFPFPEYTSELEILKWWNDPQTKLRAKFEANMTPEFYGDPYKVESRLGRLFRAYVDKDKMDNMKDVLDLLRYSRPGNELYELKEKLSTLRLLLDGYLRLGFSVDGSNIGNLALLLPSGEDIIMTISRSPHIEDWQKENFPTVLGVSREITEMSRLYEDPTLPTIPEVDDLLLLLQSPLIQMRIAEKSK